MPESSSLRSSSPPLAAGHVVGDKFEIGPVLGEGGTGVVYDARRIAENDHVALKVIHSHLLGDEQIRGRFAREAAILRRLEGPNLCPMLDYGELPDPRNDGAGVLYLALAKIDGEPLDRVIAREGAFAPERAVKIILQVCAALEAAHGQGVIHRDLKPANVILKSGDHAVVVDFGLAKIITGAGGTGTTALTVHNMIFGTPEYMAPEQARGDDLDARCDVYAVGVMLYQLLTGHVPFTGASPLNVLTAHMTSAPVSPIVRAPDRAISPALDAVILHALAKDPANRYLTAPALANALTHALAHPGDIEGVKPHGVLISIEGENADGHSMTIPSPIPMTPESVLEARRLRVTRSGYPPSSDPPFSKPTSSRSAPRKEPGLLERRGWAMAWVLAAIVSIAVGVYLSLRS
jgi:serine/threonine protein kinase